MTETTFTAVLVKLSQQQMQAQITVYLKRVFQEMNGDFRRFSVMKVSVILPNSTIKPFLLDVNMSRPCPYMGK